MNTAPRAWDIDGSGRMTDEQRRMLNAICGDLSRQVSWFGERLTKDGWRHFLSGHVLGWRMLPGIDRGEGPRGFVMLGGSSKELSKTLARNAITCGLQIGDHPDEQGLSCSPVRWSDVVLLGLGINPRDLAA